MVRSSLETAAALVAVGEFLRHPGMVGSAFPASGRMVRKMLDPLDWSRIDVLVEYGPGTGRFTFAALARLKPGARLVAIETGDQFAEHLRSEASDARLTVVQGSAGDVLRILEENGLTKADCIISGLPFSTLPDDEAEQIMSASKAALRPDGIFAAYQMRTAIEPLLGSAFNEVAQAYEWWNIPPCHLYWASGPR